MSIQKQGYLKKKLKKKKAERSISFSPALKISLPLRRVGGLRGSRIPSGGGGLPVGKEEQEPRGGAGGHRCNLPGDTGEQHAALKELKVLLLSATEGFVKLTDLNLTDKHK